MSHFVLKERENNEKSSSGNQTENHHDYSYYSIKFPIPQLNENETKLSILQDILQSWPFKHFVTEVFYKILRSFHREDDIFKSCSKGKLLLCVLLWNFSFGYKLNKGLDF